MRCRVFTTDDEDTSEDENKLSASVGDGLSSDNANDEAISEEHSILLLRLLFVVVY